MTARGLLLDFGGVLTSSVGRMFRVFEDAHDLPKGTLFGIVRSAYGDGGEDSEIARLERGELETVVFDAMLESLASEMASRRMAMKGATDAATRMGKELRMVYNRARQESITKELLDIIGGTNAVS